MHSVFFNQRNIARTSRTPLRDEVGEKERSSMYDMDKRGTITGASTLRERVWD